MSDAAAAAPVLFSVLIGRVSTEDGGRIIETLDALRRQDGAPRYEVILADRIQDALSVAIGARYAEVRLIACAAPMSLPEMRTLALDHARGTYVAVTEDHCVPAQDWLARMRDAFGAAPAAQAVGGCVENGVGDTGLDRAAFLCEYSDLLGPVPEGRVASLPGMNVAYRRTALTGLDRSLLTSGFWETTLHPILACVGDGLHSSNAIRIFHKKKFSFRLFASQRFLYSRYYAGLRFGRADRLRRWAACIATAVLPPLLLFRVLRNLRGKRRLGGEVVAALPSLGVFVVIWAIGEMAGYVLGPGDALSRIE